MSIQHPVVREVQGTEYTFYAMSALVAWPVWLRLQKLSIKPLLQVIATPDMDLGPQFLVRAMAALIDGMEPEDRERVVLPLLGKVTCNGVPVGGTDDAGRSAFALHFAARYGLLVEVLAVAIEVNFVDFYKVLKDLLLGVASQLADLAPPKTNVQPVAVVEDPTTAPT